MCHADLQCSSTHHSDNDQCLVSAAKLNNKLRYHTDSVHRPSITTHCHNLDSLEWLYSCLGSVNLMQLALKSAILCEITCNDHSRSLKVTAFAIDQRLLCNFLLLNNTKLHLIWHCFWVNVAYWSILSLFTGRGCLNLTQSFTVNPKLLTAKFGFKKTRTITLLCGAQHISIH